MFWFYSAAFSLETSQIEIQLKVILYVLHVWSNVWEKGIGPALQKLLLDI